MVNPGYFYETLRQSTAEKRAKEANELELLGPIVGALAGFFTGGPVGAVMGGLGGLGTTKGQGIAGIAQAGLGGYTGGTGIKADFAKQTALEKVRKAVSEGKTGADLRGVLQENIGNLPDVYEKQMAESLFPKPESKLDKILSMFLSGFLGGGNGQGNIEDEWEVIPQPNTQMPSPWRTA